MHPRLYYDLVKFVTFGCLSIITYSCANAVNLLNVVWPRL